MIPSIRKITLTNPNGYSSIDIELTDGTELMFDARGDIESFDVNRNFEEWKFLAKAIGVPFEEVEEDDEEMEDIS
jgi:hypothetical protein